MRIATKRLTFLQSTIVALGCFSMAAALPAHAEGAAIAPGVSVSNTPVTTTPPPAIVAPPPAPSLMPPAPLSTVTVTPPANDPGGEKSISSLENKVTDSAKEVAKNFASPTTSVTLDDLNSAKVAIAKIDVMIDLEKKLAELDKARNEREGGSAKSFTPIPASVLAPPPPPPPVKMVGSGRRVEEEPPQTISKIIRLLRVEGSGGRNIAYLGIDGQEKTVRVGDTLPDGSLVTSIVTNDVEYKRKDGMIHHAMLNLDVVYGRSY